MLERLKTVRLSHTQWMSVCASLMLLCIVGLHVTLPRISAVYFRAVDGEQETTQPSKRRLLPIRGFAPKNGPYEVQMNVEYRPWQSTAFHLVPTWCVKRMEVNGRQVEEIQNVEQCAYERGFRIDLGAYLQDGTNNIVMRIWGENGTVGIHAGPMILSSPYALATWIGIGFFVAMAGLLFHLLARAGIDRISSLIFLAGCISATFALWRFSYALFANDWWSHVEYIFRISATKTWPSPYSGWVYYHPPTYYTIAALIHTAANHLGTLDPMTMVRFFSYACFIVFLLLGTLTLRLMIRDTRAFRSAMLLLLFWPVGALVATRVDSHALLYPLYAACGYFMLLAVRQRSLQRLMWAAVFASAALGVRSNALLLFAMLVWVLPLFIAPSRSITSFLLRVTRVPAFKVAVVVLMVGLALNYGRTSQYRTGQAVLVGNLSQSLKESPIGRIEDKGIWGYTLLHLPHYFETSSWDIYQDKGGRHYFWNVFFKSSVFGHYQARWQIFAYVLITLMPIIWGVVAVELTRLWREPHPERWLYLGWVLVPVMLMLVYRWQFDVPSSQDFRYVYPLVIALSGVFGLAVQRAYERGKTTTQDALHVICGLMVIASAGMYLSQWFITKRMLGNWFG